MKAIVYTEYGPPDVLQLKEVATPTPSDDEVLLKIRAASAIVMLGVLFTLYFVAHQTSSTIFAPQHGGT